MNRTDHYDDYAKELEGNWRKFKSFGWHDEPKNGERWCIVYTSNRDSALCEQSNAAAIDKALAGFPETECRSESHGHWAVGYVNGYAIKVRNDDGTYTGAFQAWCDLQLRLADYPLLDEDDHSQREYEATLEGIEQVGRRMVRNNPPPDWAGLCFDWFWNNDQSAVESRDDQGGYPSDEQMKTCLAALELLEEAT
jgi:hypothetical protein